MSETGWRYGWKDIGAFIGCSAKQAQYYEKNHGLPIHRLPNNKVAGDPSEIDKWIRTWNKNKN